MVIVLLAKEAVTPAGKPVAVPIPVAPVVAWVILVIKVLMQSVGVEDAAPTVLAPLITIAPDTELVIVEPQPLVTIQ